MLKFKDIIDCIPSRIFIQDGKNNRPYHYDTTKDNSPLLDREVSYIDSYEYDFDKYTILVELVPIDNELEIVEIANNNDVEFTDDQVDRIDDIYNTVYDTILIIVNEMEEMLPFNINFVGPCTEALISAIFNTGIVDSVYFPIRYTDESGNLQISDYYGKELM